MTITKEIVQVAVPKIDIDDNIGKWYYQTEDEQIDLVVKMLLIGNGAARFNLTDHVNQDSIDLEILENLLITTKCVSKSGSQYYSEFRQDVQIGSVIINCFSQLGYFSD